jgi:hypothetical protein
MAIKASPSDIKAGRPSCFCEWIEPSIRILAHRVRVVAHRGGFLARRARVIAYRGCVTGVIRIDRDDFQNAMIDAAKHSPPGVYIKVWPSGPSSGKSLMCLAGRWVQFIAFGLITALRLALRSRPKPGLT